MTRDATRAAIGSYMPASSGINARLRHNLRLIPELPKTAAAPFYARLSVVLGLCRLVLAGRSTLDALLKGLR